MPEVSILVEILYFSGGLKNVLVGLPDDDATARPDWLPSYELVGLKNDIQLSKDEYVIELARFKRQNCYVTWIGVFEFCEDAVYGDRSNYAGVGVWLKDLFPGDTESIVDALLQICDKVAKNGPTNLIVACRQLVQDKGYLPSWVGSLRDLPSVEGGLTYDTDGLPRTAYIGVELEKFRDEFPALCNSLLVQCFNADAAFASVSRLLYLVVRKGQAPRSGQDVFRLTNPHVAAALLAYFRSSIARLQVENETLLGFRDGLIADVDHNRLELAKREEEIQRLKQRNSKLEVENSDLKGQWDKEIEHYRKKFSTLYTLVEREASNKLARNSSTTGPCEPPALRASSASADTAAKEVRKGLFEAKRELTSISAALRRLEFMVITSTGVVVVAVFIWIVVSMFLGNDGGSQNSGHSSPEKGVPSRNLRLPTPPVLPESAR